MACGVYPVVTNVGDSASIVGKHGKVVDQSDPSGLDEALYNALLDDRIISPNEIRERIVKNFNIDLMVNRTENLLKELCGEEK
jgi:glycosyltransferase involved in cell wall biosynthesis